MNNDWIRKYNKLNNSFNRKLIFRLGANAGFFSEFNNMVFAMIYCLENRIQFLLSSKNSNFSIEKGWRDFFEPFCTEVDASFHFNHNVRPYQIEYIPNKGRWNFEVNVYKVLHPRTSLTQDLWSSFHNKSFINKNIVVKELGIDGPFLEATKIIVDNIWQLKSDIKERVEKTKARIQLPSQYLSFHIRSGDKAVEHKLFPVELYMEKAKEGSVFENVFVATDDYRNLEDLRKKYPEYRFFSLCQPSAAGYLQSDFDNQHGDHKMQHMINLFADIELLAEGELFIGTYNSNIGMFLGMKLGESRCRCLDFDSWKFWSTADF